MTEQEARKRRAKLYSDKSEINMEIDQLTKLIEDAMHDRELQLRKDIEGNYYQCKVYGTLYWIKVGKAKEDKHGRICNDCLFVSFDEKCIERRDFDFFEADGSTLMGTNKYIDSAIKISEEMFHKKLNDTMKNFVQETVV